MTLVAETPRPAIRGTDTMRATVFHGPNDIRVEEVPRPHAGAGEAVIRVTLTTICGTDVHILKGEYPVRPGLVIGHEPVGVIDELGAGVTGYEIGDRVLVGAITPCGQCRACLSGNLSQCGHGGGYEALGGWRFGNTIDGAQAEYLLVPSAQANLTPIPDDVTRRAGRPARRHRLDRLQRRRVRAACGSATRSSSSPRARSACAPTAGAQADGRVAHHRRRQRPGPPRDGQAHGRRRRRSTSPRSTSSPKSSG